MHLNCQCNFFVKVGKPFEKMIFITLFVESLACVVFFVRYLHKAKSIFLRGESKEFVVFAGVAIESS